MSTSNTNNMSTNSSSSRPENRGRRPQLTHFLCLPLHSPHKPPLTQQHTDFATALSRLPDSSPEIPRDAFRPFDTLHLTLGVLSLTPQSKLDEAIRTLEKDWKGGRGTKITLRGLHLMPGSSPRSANVVYTAPDEIPELRELALDVRKYFVDRGLSVEETRELKLHATIVNTIYCKSSNNNRRGRGGGGGSHGKRVTVDVRELLELYGDYVFSEELELDRVEICKMGAKKGVEVLRDDGSVGVEGGGYEVVATRLLE